MYIVLSPVGSTDRPLLISPTISPKDIRGESVTVESLR